ncbi:MAG: MOSC domain-containing protein [Methanobacteriaceae archaeon]|nr:MOSC domain-containing protein [Methanobacteriaceae archaeon]MDP3485250.1 MOSC domain-containing protein [Methanobacteriaceae archaeon]MDP3623981.1 MOSC domain-containing protein [Methanobacteriaceae archaeon]
MGKIIAVCISNEKQTKKKDINQGHIIKNHGLEGDAHADSDSHRQISLLAQESIDKMKAQGLDVKAGDFAENLTTTDIDLKSLPVGTVLKAGEEVLLEITQIGKECHTPCAIYHQVGNCVMPTEGIFAVVLEGGVIKSGDQILIKD